MTPSPKPRSRPKPPRGKTLHGHAGVWLDTCKKCLRNEARCCARFQKALLKQRRAIRTKIQAKGKPRFKQGRAKDFLKWIRTLPCAVGVSLLCDGPIEAAHVRSRGAGGADIGNVIPLCSEHHRAQHGSGIQSFAQFYYGSLDELKRVAASYGEQYERAVELGWTPGDV